jgi:hypothetical protein
MQVSIAPAERKSVADYDISDGRVLRTTYRVATVLLRDQDQLTGSNSLSFQVWSNQG